jgi:hypothetical protein
MGQYKCSKCPETMDSKCPSARSIFPTNRFVTMVKGTMLMKTKPYREGSKFVCLELEFGCEDEGTRASAIFAELVRCIHTMTDEQAEILACDHDWYLPEGQTCSLEGHDHNRRDDD